MANRRIAIALAISLLLHLALVAGPGWLLPGGDAVKSRPIQAVLRPPPTLAAATGTAPAVAAPAPKPKPKPKPKPEPRPELPAATLPDAVPEVPAPTPAAETATEPEQGTQAGAGEAPVEPSPAGQPAAAVSAAAPAPADLFPYHGRVVFEAARGAGFVVGNAEAVWLTQDGRYQFRLYLQTTGVLALIRRITIAYASDGRITANGFVPEAYRMDQDGQLKESATFDWGQRRLAIVSNKGHGNFELKEASQDFISAIFQIALFPPTESPADVWVASGRYYTNRYYEIVGTEELTTRLGPLRTLRLRLGREGEEQLDLWYALDLRYLPVRIRIAHKDGGISDFVATTIEYDTGKDRIRLAPPPQVPVPAG